MTTPKGRLIIIGGAEQRDADSEILQEVAKAANGSPLLLLAVASSDPDETIEQYTEIFGQLGVSSVESLAIREREEAKRDDAVAKVARAGVIFFTGGDQLRITSQLADTPVYQCLKARYADGLTIAGTSAGAAAMPATMIISGQSDSTTEVSGIGMAAGMGLIDGVVIDSHFAERGRFGRLVGAVAENPAHVGLGLDEDTAIEVHDGWFTVIGSGGVYVLDGSDISFSSLSERKPVGVMSIHDVRVHLLASGDRYDLRRRRPDPADARDGG
jgi:cyanophycinase